MSYDAVGCGGARRSGACLCRVVPRSAVTMAAGLTSASCGAVVCAGARWWDAVGVVWCRVVPSVVGADAPACGYGKAPGHCLVVPGLSSTCWCGGVLLSHILSGAVPSPCQVLASGFGMGPGVSPGPWPPQVFSSSLSPRVAGGGCLGTGWWTRACVRVRVCWCSRRFVLMLVSCVSRSVVCPGRWFRRGAGVGRVRPLVPVGSTARAASTSGLSTTCSRVGSHTPLRGVRNPYLGAGFPLRCFQRLSLPNVANRPCRWRDNRHTRGSSTQVLSYYGQASSGFQRAQRIETKLSHDVLNPARVPL